MNQTLIWTDLRRIDRREIFAYRKPYQASFRANIQTYLLFSFDSFSTLIFSPFSDFVCSALQIRFPRFVCRHSRSISRYNEAKKQISAMMNQLKAPAKTANSPGKTTQRPVDASPRAGPFAIPSAIRPVPLFSQQRPVATPAVPIRMQVAKREVPVNIQDLTQ